MNLALVDDVDTFLNVDRYHKMACQSVARTAWHNAERSVGMNNGACHFIDCSVATDSYYNINAFVFGTTGYRRGITGTFRILNLVVEDIFVDFFVYNLRYLAFA